MLYNLLKNPEFQNWLVDIGLYRVVQVLHQLEFRAFAAVVLSFLIVLLFGKRTIAWLIRQKIGDAPQFYHDDVNALMQDKASTPTMGGLLICSAIGVTMLLLADLTEPYVHLGLVVLLWLALVGSADDWLKLTTSRRHPGSREGLFAWEKLLFQLGIGVAASIYIYRYLQAEDNEAVMALTLPFQRTYEPGTGQVAQGLIPLSGVAFVLLGTLLIAGTSNAVNLTDGMDGLAAGTMTVACFAFMVLCYIAGTQEAAQTLLFPHVSGARELMVVTGAMAGACLGFLWFNCAPAQVFMGDTGSLPLGGLLAYVAIAIRQEVLLVIIGGVFFLEMASVMLQVGYFKYTGGKRIFRCSPVHHHYHLGGWSEQQVVTRFWVLAVIFTMLALVSIKLR